MVKNVRILMTGSRTWSNYEEIEEALVDALYYFNLEDNADQATLINGTAGGADRLCAKAAKKLGMAVEDHPAQWKVHDETCPETDPGDGTCWTGRPRGCKRAGFRRNAEMIASGFDLLLAFVHNGSNGATMTVNMAKREGKEIWIYELND